MQGIIIVCAFASMACLGWFVTRLMVRPDDRLRSRLTGGDVKPQNHPNLSPVEVLRKIGQAAAKPFMPKTAERQSTIRKQLAQAGIYDSSAIRLVAGMKVICLVIGLAGGYVAGTMMENTVMGLSMGGIVGYLIPTFWLKGKINGNQRALNHGLPDALDLMVVCVESGLTLEATIQRVGQELAPAHPAIAREFGITHMETRVGLSRAESLRHLGQRTCNAALQSLSALLIQADRFGTSIGQALRVHADSLRHSRQHVAEEMAAKASVKMSFPLVMFIFPATFLILAGPTMINLMNSALFKE